jgi:hypothetical protein
VGDDEVMLALDCRLDVVADQACTLARLKHRTRITIRQRALLAWFALEQLLGLVKLPHPFAQLADLLLQAIGQGLEVRGLDAVCSFQRVEVALDALLDLLLASIDLARREVAIATVDRFELAAVNGHHGLREELHLPAQNDEAAAHVANAFAVFTAEVGDGLEVRRQAACQPHEFDIALRLAFQPATGLDPVEIAVDVQLEQDRGVVPRATRGCRVCAAEAECG